MDGGRDRGLKMSAENGAGVAAGEGGTTRMSGSADGMGCSIVRKLQLSQACVESGLDHLRVDAVHVAAQDVVDRWDAGGRAGLMFMSLSHCGKMYMGCVHKPASAFAGGTSDLGRAVWMMACDQSTAALLVWTDCDLWAEHCHWVLGKGQVLMQCLDHSGWQATVLEPRKTFVHGWSRNGLKRRLIEVEPWQSAGLMSLN